MILAFITLRAIAGIPRETETDLLGSSSDILHHVFHHNHRELSFPDRTQAGSPLWSTASENAVECTNTANEQS
jgi:hypothetical protein